MKINQHFTVTSVTTHALQRLFWINTEHMLIKNKKQKKKNKWYEGDGQRNRKNVLGDHIISNHKLNIRYLAPNCKTCFNEEAYVLNDLHTSSSIKKTYGKKDRSLASGWNSIELTNSSTVWVRSPLFPIQVLGTCIGTRRGRPRW